VSSVATLFSLLFFSQAITWYFQGEVGAASSKGKALQADGPTLAKRQEALFSVATSPAKNVGMMAFMMYMAGSQLHFFSIMATMNGLYSPLNAILKSKLMFQPDPEGKLNVVAPRLLYCLIHAGGLAFAIYRIHLMGLLPTHLADWVASVQAPGVVDRAVTGLLGGPWG
jgi:ER membrane protein complex subunit 4